MGGHICTRKVHDSLCLRSFPKENIILTNYMLSAWWLHLLDRLGHYIIHPGEVAHIMVIKNNIMDLGYTYAKRSLNDPLDIFFKIAHIGPLIACIL